MIRILLISIITGLSLHGMAQSSVQEILLSVEKNNPKLKAQEKYLEVQKLGIQSKNNLADPVFEWEKSFSSEEGKPYEILISQSFDFPTSYHYKNQLKKGKIANLENYRSQIRQEILLETQLACFQLIYRNKQHHELGKRLENAEKLNLFFEKKLQEGDANILEINKIKLLLINIKNQLQMTEAKQANLKEDLKKLNGGIELNFDLEEYPILQLEQDFNLVFQNSLAVDPYLKSLEANEKMASKETSLVKTNSFPKISIGYRYLDSDIMKEANGMKLGISIPLWENKNKLKQAKLLEQFRKDEFSIGRFEKENEFQKLLQTYFSLKTSLSDYRVLFTDKKYDNLLRRALDFGEISGIEYIMESVYYYESYDTLLEMEQEYYKTLALLLKYKL